MPTAQKSVYGKRKDNDDHYNGTVGYPGAIASNRMAIAGDRTTDSISRLSAVVAAKICESGTECING